MIGLIHSWTFDRCGLTILIYISIMEVYEIIALCISIAIASLSFIALMSFFYCIYISLRGCFKPSPTPVLDGTATTDHSGYYPQFPNVVIEKYNPNVGLFS